VKKVFSQYNRKFFKSKVDLDISSIDVGTFIHSLARSTTISNGVDVKS